MENKVVEKVFAVAAFMTNHKAEIEAVIAELATKEDTWKKLMTVVPGVLMLVNAAQAEGLIPQSPAPAAQ